MRRVQSYIYRKNININFKTPGSARLMSVEFLGWIWGLWSAVQMLIMAKLHDCMKIAFYFIGTVSYLFPLEMNGFEAPGLAQHVWILDNEYNREDPF